MGVVYWGITENFKQQRCNIIGTGLLKNDSGSTGKDVLYKGRIFYGQTKVHCKSSTDGDKGLSWVVAMITKQDSMERQEMWYLDSRGCHKKVPQTTWLKRAEIYSILVLKVEVQNHGVSIALLSLKVLGENPFTPLS